MTKQAIREFVSERGIKGLYHFTRLANIPTIMQHGIYPISRTGEVGITPAINDKMRLDYRTHGSSLSIGHPNSKMFYKYRMEDKAVEWAVLGVKASILWEKECAFCRFNAADARISQQPTASLSTVTAFKEMFDETEGLPSRREQRLRTFDPTDVQAEVMVFDVIEPRYLMGVIFNTEDAKKAHLGMITEKQGAVVHERGGGVFATRDYRR